MAHAMIRLHDQSVVAAVNIAHDRASCSEIGIGAPHEQRFGEGASRYGTAAQNGIRNCSGTGRSAAAARYSGAGADVRVFEVGQLATQASEIADGEYRVRTQIMFQG